MCSGKSGRSKGFLARDTAQGRTRNRLYEVWSLVPHIIEVTSLVARRGGTLAGSARDLETETATQACVDTQKKAVSQLLDEFQQVTRKPALSSVEVSFLVSNP